MTSIRTLVGRVVLVAFSTVMDLGWQNIKATTVSDVWMEMYAYEP